MLQGATVAVLDVVPLDGDMGNLNFNINSISLTSQLLIFRESILLRV
jgi:hypothetical protein